MAAANDKIVKDNEISEEKKKNQDRFRVWDIDQSQGNNHDRIFYLPIKYTNVIQVSHGSLSTIVRASKPDQTRVIVKKVHDTFGHALPNSSLRKSIVNMGDVRTLRTIRHLQVSRFVNHPAIISMNDWIPPRKGSQSPFRSLFLEMPSMTTNLQTILDSPKSRPEITLVHIRFIMLQILLGVRYLHAAGILHGDLKPANIFANADCFIKIGDFDLVQPINGPGSRDEIVTRWYRAPEVCLGCNQYSTAIDVWSIGCIFADLFIQNGPLFKGQDDCFQLDAITRRLGTPTIQEYLCMGLSGVRSGGSMLLKADGIESLKQRLPYPKPIDWTKELKIPDKLRDNNAMDLLKQFLVIDPTKRITVEKAIKHPFFINPVDLGRNRQTQNAISKTGIESASVAEFPTKYNTGLDASFWILPQYKFPFTTVDSKCFLNQVDIQHYLWKELLQIHPEQAESYEEWKREIQPTPPSTPISSSLLSSMSISSTSSSPVPDTDQKSMVATPASGSVKTLSAFVPKDL